MELGLEMFIKELNYKWPSTTISVEMTHWTLLCVAWCIAIHFSIVLELKCKTDISKIIFLLNLYQKIIFQTNATICGFSERRG